MGGEEEDDRHGDADQKIGRVGDPEDRCRAQNHIAHRAAADPGHRGEEEIADDVELLA
ncbi:hypothetical protein D9M70_510860 [compost metagenome]